MNLDGHDDRKPNDSRGFVHKRILGAVSGFATGGFSGGVTGFVTSGRSTRGVAGLSQAQPPRGPVGVATTGTFRIGPFGIERSFLPQRLTIPQGTGTAIGEIIGVGLDRRGRGPVAPTADGCPKGFHLNKSAYTLKSGARIEERTLCVKNRRRNNDNGAAAMRAARRLIGRKKSQDTIDKALRAIAPSRSRRSKAPRPSHGGPIVVAAG